MKAGALIAMFLAVVMFIVSMPLIGRAAAGECNVTTTTPTTTTTTTTTTAEEGIYLVLMVGSDLAYWENGRRVMEYDLVGETADEIVTVLRGIYQTESIEYNFTIYRTTQAGFSALTGTMTTERGYAYTVVVTLV